MITKALWFGALSWWSFQKSAIADRRGWLVFAAFPALSLKMWQSQFDRKLKTFYSFTVETNNRHGFHFRLTHPGIFGRRWGGSVPSRVLTLCLRIIFENPLFVSGNFLENSSHHEHNQWVPGTFLHVCLAFHQCHNTADANFLIPKFSVTILCTIIFGKYNYSSVIHSFSLRSGCKRFYTFTEFSSISVVEGRSERQSFQFCSFRSQNYSCHSKTFNRLIASTA